VDEPGRFILNLANINTTRQINALKRDKKFKDIAVFSASLLAVPKLYDLGDYTLIGGTYMHTTYTVRQRDPSGFLLVGNLPMVNEAEVHTKDEPSSQQNLQNVGSSTVAPTKQQGVSVDQMKAQEAVVQDSSESTNPLSTAEDAAVGTEDVQGSSVSETPTKRTPVRRTTTRQSTQMPTVPGTARPAKIKHKRTLFTAEENATIAKALAYKPSAHFSRTKLGELLAGVLERHTALSIRDHIPEVEKSKGNPLVETPLDLKEFYANVERCGKEKGQRTKFNAEDDAILLDYVASLEKNRGSLRMYEVLEKWHPQHTSHQWKNRWMRFFNKNERLLEGRVIDFARLRNERNDLDQRSPSDQVGPMTTSGQESTTGVAPQTTDLRPASNGNADEPHDTMDMDMFNDDIRPGAPLSGMQRSPSVEIGTTTETGNEQPTANYSAEWKTSSRGSPQASPRQPAESIPDSDEGDLPPPTKRARRMGATEDSAELVPDSVTDSNYQDRDQENEDKVLKRIGVVVE
jgi:hypothetical protein